MLYILPYDAAICTYVSSIFSSVFCNIYHVTLLSNSCLLVLLRYYADQLIGAEWRIYALVQHTNIASDYGLSPVWRQAII